MLDNTYSINWDATPVTLTRVSEQNFESVYYGEEGDRKFHMTVKHTIPARGESGESHLIRLDVEKVDASGVYQKTTSPWMVIKTFDGVQDSTECQLALAALLDFAGVTANTDKVIARES